MLRSLCPEYPELPDSTRKLVELQVTDAVRRHRSLLPSYSRYPVIGLGLLFEGLPLLWKGRRYSLLHKNEQARYLALWQASPLAPFIDFHQSLVALTFLDHPLVRQQLEAE